MMGEAREQRVYLPPEKWSDHPPERHVYRQWVGEDDCGMTCCLAPKTDRIHIEAELSDEPQATLDTFECDECTNEVEGVCSVCGAYVCGSCFNGNHEWRWRTPGTPTSWPTHGPTKPKTTTETIGPL